MYAKRFINRILSLLFPHRCAFCRRMLPYDDNTYICSYCKSSLPYNNGTRCAKCSAPREEGSMPVCFTCRKLKRPFVKAFIPLLYEGTVRKSILSFKFYSRRSNCRAYAHLICDRIISEGFPDFDFITFVPISEERKGERLYNQSEAIAVMCGEILNLPVISTLSRADGTKRQSSLRPAEREKNAKISFVSKNISLSGTALLIDDIYTTGATLSHTASLLLKMGCDKVYVSAVAINPKK